MSKISIKQIGWLWQNWIPLGKISILDGDPGLGKSTLLLDIAARVSTSGIMPDGSQGTQGSVILLSAEDDSRDTVKPRLIAASANEDNVICIEDVANAKSSRPVSLPQDLHKIDKVIEKYKAKMVILDPIFSYLDCDINSDREVKQVMHVFKSWCEKTGVALIGLRHINKALGMKALYRGIGSIAIIAAARSAMLAAKNPVDEESAVVAVTKSNLAKKPESLVFKLELSGSACRVNWIGGTPLLADDLVQAEMDQEEKSALEEACDFITVTIASGPVSSIQINEMGKQASIAPRTLKRAKSKLGVVSKQLELHGQWYWGWKEHFDMS